jgi:D-glycero-alpha-D-manno-heptose-7-phosphate kinase
MIISRTPLRMSFVGGGSDMPQYYREYGGAVLSTAVDKYIYVTANSKFDNGIRVGYSVNEEVNNVSEIQHRLVRHALQYTGVTGGIEMTSVADVPSRGTGLGSSSSFAVGLLNVLYAFQGKFVPSSVLAKDACHIEIDLMGEPIGKQDQFSAACGGLSLYEFHGDEKVGVSPISMSNAARSLLDDNILMFYTGVTRSASAILQKQADNISVSSHKVKSMKRMVELAYILRDELQNNNIDSFGDILHENWVLKKTMAAGISNSTIDDAYDRALKAGALGGKILGAGAGGFFIFYVPKGAHEAVKNVLNPMRYIPVCFERSGSKIIFSS